jgi:hypothetical protein
MGLFDGKVRAFGEKLSDKLRERAAIHHERAANYLSEPRSAGTAGLVLKESAIGETLEAFAEVIEQAIGDET